MINLLLIVNELKYTCGVTNHILHLAGGLTASGRVKLWIITGGGNGVARFANMDIGIITDERFLHSNRSFSGHISAINFLVKFVRENKIDILHSHYHYGAAIARRVSKLAKRITIQTNHGIIPEVGRLKHFNADKYVVINEHIRNYILHKKIAAEKDIYFIRCGIPVESTIPVKNVNNIKVIAASRFVEGKGIDTYIKAVGILVNKEKMDVSFSLAGEGPLEDELKTINETLGAGVTFAGRVIDMYSLLRQSHIVVFPGVSGSEGFPAIITEAGATGCLLISSRFEGGENILIDGSNCLMYPPGDVDKLAEILGNSIKNYASLKSIAENLHTLVKKEFGLQTMTDKHLLMYGECLAR
ncbi:MAG: glycosyltransferase family 4 protein [Ignavibacteria bacterium]|nr:glycosyltransferase family 4 protein [Ignavibacteria bacterium]